MAKYMKKGCFYVFFRCFLGYFGGPGDDLPSLDAYLQRRDRFVRDGCFQQGVQSASQKQHLNLQMVKRVKKPQKR